jgi:hypothetical protein
MADIKPDATTTCPSISDAGSINNSHPVEPYACDHTTITMAKIHVKACPNVINAPAHVRSARRTSPIVPATAPTNAAIKPTGVGSNTIRPRSGPGSTIPVVTSCGTTNSHTDTAHSTETTDALVDTFIAST